MSEGLVQVQLSVAENTESIGGWTHLSDSKWLNSFSKGPMGPVEKLLGQRREPQENVLRGFNGRATGIHRKTGFSCGGKLGVSWRGGEGLPRGCGKRSHRQKKENLLIAEGGIEEQFLSSNAALRRFMDVRGLSSRSWSEKRQKDPAEDSKSEGKEKAGCYI